MSARELILDAGVQILHELGVVAGVDHVKLSAACERAGYTTGAAYRCWPTQAEFHRELAVTAILWRDRPSAANLVASVREAIEEHALLLEALRIGAEANVLRRADERDFLVTLALRASADDDPALAAARATRVADGIADHEDIFAAFLIVFGRQLRPPFTLRQLVTAIAALAEGFALQDFASGEHPRLDRPDLGDGVGTDWTLFGTSLQFVIEGFTEEKSPEPTESSTHLASRVQVSQATARPPGASL